jgi:YidC/Oxa1 family membrane protein insertase
VAPAALHGRPDIYLNSPFDVFKPIQHLWQSVIEDNLAAVLNFMYLHFQAVPALAAIGAYGVAIVVFTIGIRLVLSPLTQFQLTTSRKSALEQRKLAPEVAELRKKFKKDPSRINVETQKLYQEHGINPLAGMVGCLPLVVQIPILTALFYVFRNFANHATQAAQFLFVPNLNDNPNHHLMLTLPGLNIGVPAITYLIFPLLAAATTFVQTKMMQMPVPPNPTEMELQTQSMQKMMVWLSPLMIGYFALNVPAGLGLYYFISNCVGITQQYFIVGWGTLLPGRSEARLAAVDLHRSGGVKTTTDSGSKSGSGGVSKSGTGNGPKGATGNGPKGATGNGPKGATANGPTSGPGSGSTGASGNGSKNGSKNGTQGGLQSGPQSGRSRKKRKR